MVILPTIIRRVNVSIVLGLDYDHARSDDAAALEALEPLYFGNALRALYAPFVRRRRDAEGKDGNPLNEVRLLCGALY